MHSKNQVSTESTPQNGRILQFLCVFEMHDSDAKNIFNKQVFSKKTYNVSDFELKILKRVSFKSKNFETSQILKQKIYNKSDFELKTLKRV